MSLPPLGSIVHYALTADDVETARRQRENKPMSFQGNVPYVGQSTPMLVVALAPNAFGPGGHGINGQAFLDGNDTIWVQCVREGEKPGDWRWAPDANHLPFSPHETDT